MADLILQRDGVEIARVRAGEAFQMFGIACSRATTAWAQMVEPPVMHDGATEDEILAVWAAWPELGLYTLVEAPPEPAPEPTIDEIRAAMATLLPVDFARMLAGTVTERWPDGILPSDVGAVISAIPDRATRELAKFEFDRARYFERVNPLIDQIGALLGLTPEQIDARWLEFTGGAPVEAAGAA